MPVNSALINFAPAYWLDPENPETIIMDNGGSVKIDVSHAHWPSDNYPEGSGYVIVQLIDNAGTVIMTRSITIQDEG